VLRIESNGGNGGVKAVAGRYLYFIAFVSSRGRVATCLGQQTKMVDQQNFILLTCVNLALVYNRAAPLCHSSHPRSSLLAHFSNTTPPTS